VNLVNSFLYKLWGLMSIEAELGQYHYCWNTQFKNPQIQLGEVWPPNLLCLLWARQCSEPKNIKK